MSVGNSRCGVWVGVERCLSAEVASVSVAAAVLVGGAPWSPRQTGILDSLGRLMYRHCPLSHGAACIRMQRLHICSPTSSSLKRRTLCCAAVPVAHSAGDLKWSFLRCRRRESARSNTFGVVSLALQTVNGQAMLNSGMSGDGGWGSVVLVGGTVVMGCV